MDNKPNLVIVGGSAAGPSAAAAARRRAPEAEIIMLEKGEYISYGACSLPYYIGDMIHDYQVLIARTPEEFREKHGIDVRLGHEALVLDPEKRRLTVRVVRTGKDYELSYDRLILATGARSKRLGIPGEEAQNIFTLKDMTDGIRIRRFIDEQKPARAVIVGAGYISLEVAEALRERGIETTLLYRGKYPYSGLEPELGPIIVEEIERHGVRYVGEVHPLAFQDQAGEARAILTDKGEFPADLFFLGVGVTPNVEMAKEAGVALGESGGIRVNSFLATNLPDIWAAGDCCEKHHQVTGRSVLIPLGDTANKEGRAAGENAVGGRTEFHGVLGTACVKIFDLEIGLTGITQAQAEALGLRAVSQVVEASSRVAAYPGAQKTLLKIVADASSGRLLGANWIGRDGEARKINTLAVALHQRMTVDDISRLDLAYAPPFSPVWDPLLIAANLLKRKIDPISVR
jgi:NADPH-dependent 2,4-dienoyl-CoA reductase/sulfur reductase-like enzyme